MGLSDSITLYFMVAGHTKFSPDRSFGLLKEELWKTAVNTLSDIAAVVTRSASCNTAELVGREDGIPLIATYDWTSSFAGKISNISGIKGYHHFSFSNTEKGKVNCRVSSDSSPNCVAILKESSMWHPTPSTRCSDACWVRCQEAVVSVR